MDISEFNQQHVEFFKASIDAIIATSANDFEITLARREHEGQGTVSRPETYLVRKGGQWVRRSDNASRWFEDKPSR